MTRVRENFVIRGRYELGELLGSGGMGRVYRAYDNRLKREVALKVLAEHHAQAPEFVERFAREVRSVASLDHPNIVKVFDSGEDEGGSPYMAMELAPGGTLKGRILTRGPLPPREAATVALQVAEALGAAHEAGIVHRDVKPENVLLTAEGDAMVADFGIARATEATAMTHTSMVLGTAPYLSPEQARGEPVGPASDLYSLGVVLYEALTGQTPFGTGEHVSPLAIAMKHCTEPAPSPRVANGAVPRPLELITLALLRKQPDERYAGAAALADDLAAFLRGEKLSSTAATRLAASAEGASTQALRPPTVPPRRRRRRKIVPVMALALACVLALAFSPLVPVQRPVAFMESTVAPDPGDLDRAVSPTLQNHPGAPEAPDGEQADRPKETQDPEREARDPEPAAEAQPAPVDAPEATAPPAGTTTESAPAGSADASVSAPAAASPSATVNPTPATDDASTPAAPEQTPPPQQPARAAAQQPAQPTGSTTPSAEETPAPAPEPPAEPTPEPTTPAPQPTTPAPERTPVPGPMPGPAASAPANGGEMEVPEVEVPEVEMPDF